MHSRNFCRFVLQKFGTVTLQSCRRSRQTIASIRKPEQLIRAQLVRKFAVMNGCDLKPAHLKSRQLFYKKKSGPCSVFKEEFSLLCAFGDW
jgi:hypothetical protein